MWPGMQSPQHPEQHMVTTSLGLAHFCPPCAPCLQSWDERKMEEVLARGFVFRAQYANSPNRLSS